MATKFRSRAIRFMDKLDHISTGRLLMRGIGREPRARRARGTTSLRSTEVAASRWSSTGRKEQFNAGTAEKPKHSCRIFAMTRFPSEARQQAKTVMMRKTAI